MIQVLSKMLVISYIPEHLCVELKQVAAIHEMEDGETTFCFTASHIQALDVLIEKCDHFIEELEAQKLDDI